MTASRASLIAAIREAHQDDALRLICADWFEEQGDEVNVARAELIRIQVQRASLPPQDVRHSELQARELRLLKRYGPAWCGSHFAFRKVRFRRGFIEYVHLHLRHFLHHRRQLLALEPVRDVSLTGWCRAPADLIRRVAGCEEWKYIETLRVHHQGPHKSPRSSLVVLLESPHLSRLRTLHCPYVEFDADARRRFERLAVLRQVKELRFPTLDTLMQHPGGWFSDGGRELAARWQQLQSLTLPYYLQMDLLQQLTEMPFWNRLTTLQLQLPGFNTPQVLSLLRDRMPQELGELRLHAGVIPDDYSGADSFFQRLAQVPLRALHLSSIPVSPETLSRLLSGTTRWDLRQLSLTGGEITDDHARVIAGSPGVRSLLSLALAGGWNLRADGARALFASEHLRSLVHLNLSGTPIGTEGAAALAAATGWDRLRSLNLQGVGLDAHGLRALLRSATLRQLTSFTFGAEEYRDASSLELPPDLAAELTRLPHLAQLYLSFAHCDPRSTQLLAASDSLAWVSIACADDDIQAYRASLAPDRIPPVDDAF